MADFDRAIAKTLPHEGYYVNDPDDPGGETYCGITRRDHPTWPGWAIIDEYKPLRWNERVDSPALDNLVKQLYREEIWSKIKGDDIQSDSVACFLFDWFVNSGYVAIRTAQRLVGCVADGVVGPNTLAGVNGAKPLHLFDGLKAARVSFVKGIAERRTASKKYLAGWLRRINSFKYDD